MTDKIETTAKLDNIRVNNLTSVSYGTLASLARQAGILGDKETLKQYDKLDEIFKDWRFFVEQTQGNSYTCWQDAWNGFITSHSTDSPTTTVDAK